MYITGDQLPIFSLFLTHLVAVWSWQLADLYCNIKANTSTYLSLSPQSGVQAVNKRPPELPILCLCFQLVPGDAHPGDACLVVLVTGFLDMCPIHLHFLLPISRSAGVCSALFHRLILLILSGQCSLGILRRQLLMKVCTFATVAFVILHITAP